VYTSLWTGRPKKKSTEGGTARVEDGGRLARDTSARAERTASQVCACTSIRPSNTHPVLSDPVQSSSNRRKAYYHTGAPTVLPCQPVPPPVPDPRSSWPNPVGPLFSRSPLTAHCSTKWTIGQGRLATCTAMLLGLHYPILSPTTSHNYGLEYKLHHCCPPSHLTANSVPNSVLTLWTPPGTRHRREDTWIGCSRKDQQTPAFAHHLQPLFQPY
jgi:hypothetical protein